MEYLQNKNMYGMKKLFIFLFIIFSWHFMQAQSITIDNYNQDAGTSLIVSVGMENISNIGAITLFISYDTLVLEFDTILNISSQFPGLLANNMQSQQKVGIAWSTASSGVSVVSEELCQIRFQFIGNSTEISFNSYSEIADFNADIIPVTFNNGSISESFTVQMSSLNPNYCTSDIPVVLAGTPAGGIFEIDGSVATEFSPATVGTGTHTITYAYVNPYGFGDTVSTSVNVFASPQISTQSSGTICFGQAVGEASVAIISGQSPYSFAWSDGQTTQTALSLIADTYYVTVTDNNGCIVTDTTEILASDEIVYNFDITNLTALGAGNGAIDLTVTSGNSPFGFLWSTGSTLEDLTALQAGVYPLTITDNLGCTQIDSAEVKAMSHHQIIIPNQWSIFSLNVEPYSPSMDIVVADIASNIILVKDEVGEVYWPFFQLNEIGNVDVGDAYQIKLIIQDTLDVDGFYIFPENTAVDLPAGWSLFGYLRTSPSLIVTVLSSLVSDVVIVKNGAGQTYWPQYNVNMIVNMNPGEGYQIKMAAQHNLFYPPN